MDIPTNISQFTPTQRTERPSSSNNVQNINIDTQKSNAKRVSIAESEHTTLSIFERSCDLFPDLPFVISHYGLSFFTLRILSRKCYHLITKPQLFGTLLAKKTFLFNYHEINSCFIQDEVQAKFEFAKAQTKVKVRISLDDLCAVSNNKASPLFSIPSEKLNLELVTLICDKEQLKPLKLLPNLTVLSINSIMQTKLELSEYNNFTILSIKSISWSTLTLSGCNNLSCLTIDKLCNDSSLELSNLNNLTTLIIKDAEYSEITLSGSFNNLQNISFGDISDHSHYTISASSIYHLTTFSLGNIEWWNIVLPDVLPNLITLHYKDIAESTHLDLSNYSFPNLRELSFGNILENATLYLPNNLPNLTTLIIGNVEIDVTIKLPQSCDNLKNFIFGEVADYEMREQLNSIQASININRSNKRFF